MPSISRLLRRSPTDTDEPRKLVFDFGPKLQITGATATLGALGITGIAGDCGPSAAQRSAPVKAHQNPAHVRTAQSMGIRSTGLPSWISVRAAAASTAPVSAHDVRFMERTLVKAGFKKTDLAKFQAAWGLEPTGILDDAAMKKLEHVAERMKNHPDYIGIGQAGPRVAKIQRELHHLGYAPEMDGVYGQETGRSMRLFRGDQKDLTNGSSTASARARKVLHREVRATQHAPYHARVKNTANHKRMEKRTSEAVRKNGGVGFGAHGPVVEYIQQHLRAAGFEPHEKGTFGERTEGMVKLLQKKNDLPQTGVVDHATWVDLRKAKMEAKDSTNPPQRIGERSNAVLHTEQRLKELTGHPRRPDRIYTEGTQHLVDNFRAKHHLGHKGAGVTARVDKALKKAVYKKRHALKWHYDTGYVNGRAYRIKVTSLEGHLVGLNTAKQYLKMKKAAARDGVTLQIVSGFRTNAEQTYLYNCYVSGNPNCNPANPPGYSNHQSGIALDLNTTGPSDAVGSGTVYNWLARNGHRFGFSRIASEHWHWEYRG